MTESMQNIKERNSAIIKKKNSKSERNKVRKKIITKKR
jgi:hypothetical protein